MSQIIKLADHVIDMIKAGEVVERPLNVVKELVENSIDAGASEICVELLDGGKQLIRISDNGIGIAVEDVPLVFERHATSKIVEFADLESVGTFGFRGEAMPSISAVSKMSLRSRQKNSELGLEIEFEEGRKKATRQVAMSEGTVVSVKDLFCSTPVRLKFLKSTATEFSHIYDYIVSLAFSLPHVKLKLIHNGRESFSVDSVKNAEERFRSIVSVGNEEFCSVKFSRGGFAITGFASLPQYVKTSPKYFVTFVNGRLVKDRVLRAGVLQAYSGLVMKGLVPSAVLFVTTDPKWVDVNAHPAKTEIRFHDPLVIQDLVTIGVQNSVKKSVSQQTEELAKTKSHNDVMLAKRTPEVRQQELFSRSANLHSSDSFTQGGHRFAPAATFAEERILRSSVATPAAHPRIAIENKEPRTGGATYSPVPDVRGPSQLSGGSLLATSGVYIGQYLNCYLIFQVEKEMWVVDQHAFHERILFEQFLTQGTAGRLERQELLTALELPMPSPLASYIFECRHICENLGFELGQSERTDCVTLRTVPALLPIHKALSIFEEICVRLLAGSQLSGTDVHPLLLRAVTFKAELQGLDLRQLGVEKKDVYHLFFATMACHAAVRAGEPLNEELVRRLISKTADVDFYAHCPHGRPVMRKFTENDVSQWFLRT